MNKKQSTLEKRTTQMPQQAPHHVVALTALPFFTDPAAFSLLLFGVATIVITIGTSIFFFWLKMKKKEDL